MSITPKVTVDEIELINGSVGTPSLRSLNYPNTGIYFPAENQMGFVSGGTERVRVENTGLKITSGVIKLLSNASNSNCDIQWDGNSNTGINHPASDRLAIVAGGQSVMVAYQNQAEFLVEIDLTNVPLKISNTEVISNGRAGTFTSLTSTGTIDFTSALFKLKRTNAAAEPTINDDETVLWWDTNLTQMWLITRRSGTQYKIQMT